MLLNHMQRTITHDAGPVQQQQQHPPQPSEQEQQHQEQQQLSAKAKHVPDQHLRRLAAGDLAAVLAALDRLDYTLPW